MAIAFKKFSQFGLYSICNITWHQIANDQAHKIAMLQFKTKALCHFPEVSCMNGQNVELFEKRLSTTGSSNKLLLCILCETMDFGTTKIYINTIHPAHQCIRSPLLRLPQSLFMIYLIYLPALYVSSRSHGAPTTLFHFPPTVRCNSIKAYR